MLNYCLQDTTCLTYADDNLIYVTSLRDRKLSSPNITAQANQCNEISTVRRRLCESGLHGRIAVKKQLLRKPNNVKRLQWAKVHKDWTSEQRNKILWTNELKFEISWSNCAVKSSWKFPSPVSQQPKNREEALLWCGVFANGKIAQVKGNWTRLLRVLSKTLIVGVLPLCTDTIGVYYSPSWLGFISKYYKLEFLTDE